VAGRVKEHAAVWESLTNDPIVQDAIKHYHIKFDGECPLQTGETKKNYFSSKDKEIINAEITKGVIE
jgi:hypothetical protein